MVLQCECWPGMSTYCNYCESACWTTFYLPHIENVQLVAILHAVLNHNTFLLCRADFVWWWFMISNESVTCAMVFHSHTKSALINYIKYMYMFKSDAAIYVVIMYRYFVLWVAENNDELLHMYIFNIKPGFHMIAAITQNHVQWIAAAIFAKESRISAILQFRVVERWPLSLTKDAFVQG